MKMDLVICGVGGQGNLLASVAIANYAMRKGLNVIGTETIGAAQRGGSVVSHLRISEEKIYSPTVPAGAADVILGFELVEALRHIDRLNPGGCYIVNSETVPTVLGNMGLDRYPPEGEILRELRLRSAKGYLINASEKARELGGAIMTNIVLLGALSRVLPFFEQEDLAAVLAELLPAKVLAVNLQALKAGYDLVA
ncbi:MAG: indolepyruvate oxidoreductase subunit beta [Firmicutes bacterium]|nr:indolepyruvate oxidoreductase subunit beta [Bacillota bacterium]